MLVYAYDQGGATTAGIVAVVQLIPAAVFAPFAATLGDRYSPGRVLTWGYVAQAAAMGATAAAILGGGPAYRRVRVRRRCGDGGDDHRPAQAVLVPSLVRVPEELGGECGVELGRGARLLVGPAAAGVILGLSDAVPSSRSCRGGAGPAALLVVARAPAIACAPRRCRARLRRRSPAFGRWHTSPSRGCS